MTDPTDTAQKIARFLDVDGVPGFDIMDVILIAYGIFFLACLIIGGLWGSKWIKL